MLRLHGGHPVVRSILLDWDAVCVIADSKNWQVKGLFGSLKKKLWDVVERPLPIPFNTSEGTLWIILRIMYKRTEKRYYLDIRLWQKKQYQNEENESKYYFSHTDIGINLPLKSWVGILTTALKLIEKYKDKIK